MATITEQEKLVEILKFTPRTYKIQMWGYGGEKVMGTVDRKIYDYFKARRLDLSDYCWDSDYADDNNIPDEMQPFPPGSWYEGDDMAHAHGVARNAGTLQIMDENGKTVYERSLENISGGDEDEPEWGGGEEVWIDMKPAGTVVFIGNSNEKGTFFEAEIPLKQPFDITKLVLYYDEIDGEELINRVEYDGEEIDNWGGDTSGKSSDFGMYIAGSQKATGSWEKYTNMDDIVYEMTDWFPKKTKPVREGVYMIRTSGKNSYTYQAKWTGEKWTSTWNDEDEIKIKEWQGLAEDPDYVDEMLTRWPYVEETFDPATLTVAFNEENFDASVEEIESIVEELGKQVNGTAVWPFGPMQTPAELVKEDTVTEESKSKWWTVKTYYKKSCEQHEYFVQREGEGRIKVIDGFRFCTYNVETNDGEFPKFEFTYVPGGNGAKDSLDMNSIGGANIESSELVEMFDGGCWGDNEFEGLTDDEVEKLKEFLSENGSYALEDDGEWYLDETEVWVWGPLEVSDDEGNTRIVCADEDGNMIDFVEE
jgi:hypothetical protein